MPREAYPKARAAALNALDLDSTLGEAHTSLAAVRFWYDWNWPAAVREFKRAIELNPSYATAHQWYAWQFIAMGRLDEAIAEMKSAHKLDPLSPIINSNLGDAHYYARRYDQAVEQYRRTLEIDPNFRGAHWGLGLAYLQKGMFEEAIEELQEIGSADLAYAYAASGNRENALTVMEELKEKSKEVRVRPIEFARAYLGIGEVDRAFDALEQAYEERSPDLVEGIYADPFYDSLRSDPRYTALLKKMGFEK